MPAAADVGQSVVAAILGLGAAGVAGGIVAMARKLLIALWKYLEHDEVPEGAKLTDWKTKLAKEASRPLQAAPAV